MSRGGRFCSMLASELGVVAAVSVVSGIRFPKPNLARRPVSILSIHGSGDAVNPYKGGGPPYWGPDSVPEAVTKWAIYNECRERRDSNLNAGVVVTKYSDCQNNTDVMLYTVLGAPHAISYTNETLGPWSKWLDVMKTTWPFFSAHPLFHTPSADWEHLLQ